MKFRVANDSGVLLVELKQDDDDVGIYLNGTRVGWFSDDGEFIVYKMATENSTLKLRVVE